MSINLNSVKPCDTENGCNAIKTQEFWNAMTSVTEGSSLHPFGILNHIKCLCHVIQKALLHILWLQLLGLEQYKNGRLSQQTTLL